MKKIKSYLFLKTQRIFFLLLSVYNHYIKYKYKKYKITILIPVYNAEKTLTKALESVLTQKTNFKFKIIIADDKSTDSTIKIIQEYKNKYPEVIFPLLRESNLGVPLNHYDAVMKHIDTEYFAILDADDYYTDNNKLQMQFDIMNKNLGLSLCSHAVLLKHQNGDTEVIPQTEPGIYKTILYVHTSTKLVRSTVLKKIKNKHPQLIIDHLLNTIALLCGFNFFINKTMSVYNHTGVGIYSSRSQEEKDKLNIIINTILFYYMRGNFMPPHLYCIDTELLKDETKLKNIVFHNNNIIHPLNG